MDSPICASQIQTTGTVINQPTPVGQKSAISAKNIPGVHENLQENLKHQSLAVNKNSPFRRLQLGEFCDMTWDYVPTRSNCPRSSNANNYKECCLFDNWPSERLQDDPYFVQKWIFSAEVHSWMNVQTRLIRWQCIHKKLLFSADFRQLVSWVRTLPKTTFVRPSPSMVSAADKL